MSYQETSRHLRIFISSTFRDMQQEREQLIKHVFPEIKKIARERFVEITEVDLRWGVTPEQAENGEALKICLDEIHKCKSSPVFFIGILGERYGWIPNTTDQVLLKDVKYQWISDYKDTSVTELEILYAVLKYPLPNQSSYFYFRDKTLSSNITSTLTPPLEPQTTEIEKKQKDLKDTIKNQKGVSIDGYESIDIFGQRVLEDLKAELDRLFPIVEIPTPIQQIRILHAQFADSRRRIYVEDKNLDSSIDTFFTQDKSYLCISAPSGMGKSALIAHSVKRYKASQPKTFVIEHYVGGGGSNSATLDRTLYRILEELKDHFKWNDELPSADKLIDEFSQWLWKIPSDTSVTIFIDALNQLDTTDNLRWLPRLLPVKTKMILSAIEPLNLENAQTLEINALDETRKYQILNQYCENIGKTFTKEQITLFLNSSQTANPLYLKIVLDEIKVFGVHEEVAVKIKSLINHQSIDDLLEAILTRLEQDYEKNGTFSEILSLIWCSREGMKEEELLELITGVAIQEHQVFVDQGNTLRLNRSELSHILLSLEEHLIEKEGLLTFFHSYLSKAIEKKYLNNEQIIQKYRLKIADYFEEGRKNNTKEIKRIAKELPYQLHLLKDEPKLLDAIGDFKIFNYCDKSNWKLEIHKYYIFVTIVDKEDIFYNLLLQSEPENEEEKGLYFAKVAIHFSIYVSYLKAQPLFEKILKLSQNTLGNEHPDTLTSMNNLAISYKSQGAYEKAQPLFEEALHLRQKNLGYEHPDTLRTMNDYAGLYTSQGTYEKAQPLYEEALSLRQNILGYEHPDTLSTMNNLAILYSSQGSYNKSQTLFEKVLNLFQKILGMEHPNTLAAMNNLAGTFRLQGAYEKAQELYELTLKFSQKNLGYEHPDTLRTMNDYAGLYTSQGTYEKAQPLYEEALSLRQNILGYEHPDTLSTMNNLAVLYSSQGSYNKSQTLFEKVLKLSQKILGKEHPTTMKSMNNLATLYFSQKAYKKAEPLFEKSLKLSQKILGNEHPDTLSSMNNLAVLYKSQGAHKKAQQLYNDMLKLQKKVQCNSH